MTVNSEQWLLVSDQGTGLARRAKNCSLEPIVD